MQRCPKCNRTYQDESQKFCTFDGGRLMVDADAPTTFDLGPTPQTDPLGATIMGPAPDMNKTVAGTPLTSEIPPSPPTGPTNSSVPTWHDAPASSTTPPPPASPPSFPSSPAPTGPTTTNPLAPPPGAALPPSGPISNQAPSGGLGQAGATSAQLPPPTAAPPGFTGQAQSGALGNSSANIAAPRPKSNRLLLVAGGVGLLLLLLIAGGVGLYFVALKPKEEKTANNGGEGPTLEKDTKTANTNANSNNANTGATVSQPPVTPPPNSTKFVNSRDKLTGSLSEHFVDFSLYYPNNWILDPKAGTSGSSNFFRATRQFQDKPDGYVLEIMTVGWYQSNGTMQLDRPIFPNRVEYFNNSLSKDFPEYQKVSEGETTVNGLQGYQFTFKSTVKGTEKGDINLWGRVIFLPVGNESAKSGVVLLMVASSDLPEIKGIEDVGEKGELPIILKTFRFGA